MSEHAAGLHDSLSFEQYHAAAGISRSMLLDIHPPSTPAHYRARWIDKAKADEDSPALRLGRLAHLMLTPDLLSELVVQPDAIDIKQDRFDKLTKVTAAPSRDGVPEGHVRVQWNNVLNECKRWNESQKKEVIDAQSWRDLHGMWKSVREQDLAGKLLRISDCERSAFARDTETGLPLKCRFDGVPRGSNVLWDLKTCEAADEESASKFVARYKLWYQAAFYMHVANLIGLERAHFYFVLVEKTPPYCCAVYQIDPYHLEAGARIIRNDLRRLADCMQSNRWPGYHADAQIVTLPKWEIESEGLEQVA